MTDLVTYATDEAMDLAVVGGVPYGFLAYRFGDGMDARTMLTPSGWDDLKVKATQGNAGGMGSVVITTLKR